MKKLFILFSLILLFSCKKENYTINTIVGEWKDNSISYTFTEDNNVYFVDSYCTLEGTYELNASHIDIIIGYTTISYDYVLNNNILYLTTMLGDTYKLSRNGENSN